MPTSFKLVGFGLLVLLAGIYMAQKDLRFMLWGKKTTADVEQVFDTHGGRLQTKRGQEVLYGFTDDQGKYVKGSDKVSKDWESPESGKLEIVYIAGSSDNNRLASKSGWTGFLVFFVGAALVAGGVWYFNRESVVEAHAETARSMSKLHQKSLKGRLGG